MRAKRFPALVVALAAASVSALSLASNAEAAPCGTRAGVTVVVEYGDPLGTSVGCVTGDPATGLAALSSAGHRYTFVPRQPGFVCTIDARPDPCNNGPANAYWSYWHAQPGGSWRYGSLRAGSHDPPSGSVEGWAFGTGKPPRSRPPVVGTSGKADSGSAASGVGAIPSATADAGTSTSATRSLPPDGRGGLGGLVGAVGLIVLLGGLAAFLARRRPHVGD
jgi:hypothetical protein